MSMLTVTVSPIVASVLSTFNVSTFTFGFSISAFVPVIVKFPLLKSSFGVKSPYFPFELYVSCLLEALSSATISIIFHIPSS